MSQPQPLPDAQPRTPPEPWPRPGQRQWPPKWAVGSDEDSDPVEEFSASPPPAEEDISDDGDGPHWIGGGVVVPATPSPVQPQAAAPPQTPDGQGISVTELVPTPIMSAEAYRAAVARLRVLEHQLYMANQATIMIRAQRDDVLGQLATYEDMLYADNSSANDRATADGGNNTPRPRRQRTHERRLAAAMRRSARARLFAAASAGTVVV